MKWIIEAEAQASECKRLAMEQAAKIVSEAEEKAARYEETSIEVCKAYKETQTKQAIEEAENAYNQTLVKKQAEAKAYCENALDNSEYSVNQIIRRIIGGDC